MKQQQAPAGQGAVWPLAAPSPIQHEHRPVRYPGTALAGPGTAHTGTLPTRSQWRSKASATAAIHKRAITTSLLHKSAAGKIEFEVGSVQRQKNGYFYEQIWSIFNQQLKIWSNIVIIPCIQKYCKDHKHKTTVLPLWSSPTSSKEMPHRKAHLFYIQWYIAFDAIIKNIIKKQNQLILSTMVKKLNHWTISYIHLNYG